LPFACAVVRSKKKSGFGEDQAADVLPPGTEVLIVVAPQAKELQIVKRLSERMGMETAIIILNSFLAEASGLTAEDLKYLRDVGGGGVCVSLGDFDGVFCAGGASLILTIGASWRAQSFETVFHLRPVAAPKVVQTEDNMLLVGVRCLAQTDRAGPHS
jgi:hypothetical protein